MNDGDDDRGAAAREAEARGKMPFRYVAEVVMGVPNLESFNTGSAILVRLADGVVVVTADHVIRGYEKARISDARVVLQVGQCPFVLEGRGSWRSARDDLAMFSVSDAEAEMIGTSIHDPPEWPPRVPAAGSFVTVVGLPSETRSVIDDFIQFGPLVAHLPVTSSFENHFTCRIDRTQLESILNRPLPPPPVRFGGISGGPVFLESTFHYPLVGIVKEVHEHLEYFVLQGLANAPRSAPA